MNQIKLQVLATYLISIFEEVRLMHLQCQQTFTKGANWAKAFVAQDFITSKQGLRYD